MHNLSIEEIKERERLAHIEVYEAQIEMESATKEWRTKNDEWENWHYQLHKDKLYPRP